MQFIDLQAQYQTLKEKIDARIHKVLDHGKYIMGPEVGELEEMLADYVGVKHVVSCANGTDALQLALMAMGIGQGDAVFCPTFTFFASAEAISFVGATPVFVDVDESTFNICPVDLEQKIAAVEQEGRLKLEAIMAVDLFGLPANYPALSGVASKYGLKIIEDAAQGFGGSINSQRTGSFGDIATTSFFPAKPLGCYGDGGAVFTDNDEYAEILKSLRVHGKGADKYDNVRIGMNSRLDTIQAAILLEKLSVFPRELGQRQNLAEIYAKQLPNLQTPIVPPYYVSAWAQYTLVTPERVEVQTEMKRMAIPHAVYYEKVMHQQVVYSSEKTYGDLGVSERLTQTVVSLPMHPYLACEDVDKVISILKKY